jgi:hypothetical protein
MIRRNIGLLIVVLLFTCNGELKADAPVLIYDNTENPLSPRALFNPGTIEVGDEIILAGTERYLQAFSFQFWGTNTASANPGSYSGTVQARVKFYQNDGLTYNGYQMPSTVLYDSGLFAVPLAFTGNTFNFTAGADFPTGGLFLAGPGGTLLTNMTWSVQFSGMGPTDAVGVESFSPPNVGGNYSDYWQNSAGWTLQTNTVPMNFAASFSATPEPSSFALGICGGLGLLVSRRLFSRKK